MSSIKLIIEPKEKDIGDNFIVRRSLPHIKKRMVGPFIFWDHMGPVELYGDKKMKVRAHPHIGLATITYLFSGEIMHRDNLGNEQAIRPGEVNWMTAGKGIAHSERAASLEHPVLLEGIQLWVALPLECEEVAPSFVHHKEKDLPLIKQDGVNYRLIAGKAFGHKSPVPVFSKLFYLNGKIEANGVGHFPVQQGQEAALYVIKGKLLVEDKECQRFHLVIFNEASDVKFEAIEDSEFMLFGGNIFPEGRHIWWNFVSSSKDRIEVAKQQWKNGDFPAVINETEKIPLPEN